MLAAERRFRIREILGGQRTVAASDLKEVLGVTTSTIRRDLAVLEQEGVLVRSHGGAVSRTSSTSFQPSYDFLLKTNRAEKEAIARETEKLILDGDIVFLEGSTTVLELARRLHRHSRLTVVTNSPAIVIQLQHCSGVAVISTGGDLQKQALYLSGVWAQRALREMRVDKAVLGVTAIDPSYGMSSANHAEAEIKRLLIKSARQRIALADHTKFGSQSFAFVGPVTDIDVLVTDSLLSLEYVHQLREAGVKVLIASPEGSEVASRSETRTG